MMICFPAKMMATLVLVAVFLLVGGIDIPATSASLPYGGRKSLSLDGSTKTVPRLQGSFEGLNITGKKIVSFQSLPEGGLLLPPPPARNRIQRPGSGGGGGGGGGGQGHHHYYSGDSRPRFDPESELEPKPEPKPEPEPEPEPEPTPPPQIL